MTTPTGMSPASRATRSAAAQERRADERRERQDAPRRRADDEPDDMGHDQPDEADETGRSRPPAAVASEASASRMPALAPDVDAQVARRRVAEQHPVERTGARARSATPEIEDERRGDEQP